MKRILSVFLLILISVQASAAFYTTEYLKGLIDSCNAMPETFDATLENFARVKDCGLSTGYILGIYDESNVISDRSKCFPETLQSEDVVRVVEHWLQAHPESWQQPADRSVSSALGEGWLCPD